jgi:hypothetical protein
MHRFTVHQKIECMYNNKYKENKPIIYIQWVLEI